MQVLANTFKKKRNTIQHPLKTQKDPGGSSRNIMIFDDGKQSFSKIQTQNFSPFKQNSGANTSYFTKDSSVLGSKAKLTGKQKEKYLNRKRILYTGIHEVPVFCLKLSSKPILASFRFTVFRMNNSQKKVFISAKLLNGQASQISQQYVHGNANLLLDISEKAA